MAVKRSGIDTSRTYTRRSNQNLTYNTYSMSQAERERRQITKELNDLVRRWEKATDSQKKIIEKQIKAKEKEQQSLENHGKIMKDVTNRLTAVKTSLDNTMTKFLTTQEAMAYNLTNSGLTLNQVTNDLKDAISGTGIVKQEKVYENLTKLVQAGIVNNAEQRAYLQTLANDLGMIFDVQNGSLTRLIRLQQSDLTSHRMAIQASLKEFLNQNFKTSEYIREGFQTVSESLLEAQSLMSSGAGMALESTIQKWMGALSSVGMSSGTIGSLSQALGALGAGNYESLSSGPGALLTMAAARAGLNIGQLLQGGLTSDSANALMASLVSYMSEIGGGSSNVVKAAYSKIFGFNVSDLASVGNLSNDFMLGIENSVIGDDISALLSKTDEYVYTTTKISNLLENMLYSWGTGIASNPQQYLEYRAVQLLSDFFSPVLENSKGLIGKGLYNILAYGPTAELVRFGLANSGAGLPSFKEAQNWLSEGKGLSDLIFNYLPVSLRNVAKSGIVGEVFNTLGFSGLGDLFGGNSGVSTAQMIFDALGNNGNFFNNVTSAFAGTLLNFANYTGTNTSGSGFIGNSLGSTTSASVQESLLQVDENPERTLTDIYNRLSDAVAAIIDLPNQPFGTVTRIAEAGNVVSIGQDSALMQDMVTYMAMNIQNIYSLLVARFTGSGSAEIVNTNSMEWNTNFDWRYTTIGGSA